MIATTIDVKDIEEFLKVQRMEAELAASLKTQLEISKISLEHTKRSAALAQTLANFKPKYKQWFKQLTPEVRKVIDRAGRFQ